MAPSTVWMPEGGDFSVEIKLVTPAGLDPDTTFTIGLAHYIEEGAGSHGMRDGYPHWFSAWGVRRSDVYYGVQYELFRPPLIGMPSVGEARVAHKHVRALRWESVGSSAVRLTLRDAQGQCLVWEEYPRPQKWGLVPMVTHRTSPRLPRSLIFWVSD